MSERRQTEMMETSLGTLGSKSITGAAAVVPTAGKTFVKIEFMTASVVAAQVDAGDDVADLTDFTSIPAGTIAYVRLSSITLTSGEAIGYYG